MIALENDRKYSCEQKFEPQNKGKEKDEKWCQRKPGWSVPNKKEMYMDYDQQDNGDDRKAIEG